MLDKFRNARDGLVHYLLSPFFLLFLVGQAGEEVLNLGGLCYLPSRGGLLLRHTELL